RAHTGSMWKPANPMGGVPVARAATSPSATARTRAAASARSSSRPKRRPQCRSADARTPATSRAVTERTGACSDMKIDDVSLTIFTWDGIPATRYHLGALASSSSSQGLLRIHTDAGLEGHAFLG